MGLPINVTLGLDKLVETIADATGLTALGKIMNAKGEAKAEALLSKKRAETNAEVEILKIQGQEKIAQYVLARNNQKVENVEDVLSKAEQQFSPEEKVSNEPVDKDWMARFLDIAEEVSDENMQEIWGRVLAGEIKKPKSYSLRTLEVLRNLSKEEATLITKISNFQVALDLLCTDDFALGFMDQITLDDIGIICGEELIRTYTVPSSGKFVFALNKQTQINVYAPIGTKFDFKGYRMTRAGMEIMGLIQEHNYADFYANLSKHIKSNGATKVTINKIINWSESQYQYVKLEEEI